MPSRTLIALTVRYHTTNPTASKHFNPGQTKPHRRSFPTPSAEYCTPYERQTRERRTALNSTRPAKGMRVPDILCCALKYNTPTILQRDKFPCCMVIS